jgi:hypothetical protein
MFVTSEQCPASPSIGGDDSDGPGDILWSSGDRVYATPGFSHETKVERVWTLHTCWPIDVSVTSNRSAPPQVDSLSLEFEAGGGASWPSP